MSSTGTDPTTGRRFLTLAQVSEQLSTSDSQTYALVRSGSLRAIKVGGRGQWRVQTSDLENFIEQAYRDTAQYVRTHPLRASDDGLTEPFPDET